MRPLVDLMLRSLLPAASAGGYEGHRPRVVMFVLNDARFDTRVRKEAEAVAHLGAEVHLVALDRRNAPTLEPLQHFTIHRVRPSAAHWSGLALFLGACALLPFLPRSSRPSGPLQRLLLGAFGKFFALYRED
jgi:hypothetical protein